MVHRLDDGVTVLQEQVLELLEKANIPTHINDKIVELIAKGEYEREGGLY